VTHEYRVVRRLAALLGHAAESIVYQPAKPVRVPRRRSGSECGCSVCRDKGTRNLVPAAGDREKASVRDSVDEGQACRSSKRRRAWSM
jgi:hypothetical protein